MFINVRQINNAPFPERVYLDVTKSCPLSCKHCYASVGKPDDGELTITELKRLVREIADAGIRNIIVSGGEPLTRTDIFEFLQFCTDTGLNTVLLTNGVLIDSSVAKILSSLNIEVRISLDGITAETHDYIRGEGNFEMVLRAVSFLKSSGTKKLSIHFTVNRFNINDILQIPYFLCEVGISDIVVSLIKPIGRALENPELIIDASLVLLVKQRLNTIYKNKAINFHFFKNSNWTGLACPAAHVKCGITSNGRITPCVFLGSDFFGGSIHDHSFENLWNNDVILVRLRNLSMNKACLQCSAIDSWHGGCRARALYFNNSLGSPDPYCCQARKQEVFLEELTESLKGIK